MPIIFVALVFFVSLFCGISHAAKMDSSIQEALYLFEMKGDFQKAISTLQNILENGDKEDQESAHFYLGKIYELSGNLDSANNHYSHSLELTQDTRKAYWLAERIRSTGRTDEVLLRNTIHLNSPIRKVFPGATTFIQLQNGTIKKIVNNELLNIAINIPKESEIFNIDPQGVWFQNETNDSLSYRTLGSKSYVKTFPVKSTIELQVGSNTILAMGERSLSILNKKEVLIQINEKYSNCHIKGYYNPTNNFILNCPDNGLHFINAEDGSENFSITEFDVIQKVFIDKKEIFFTSGGNLYCYQPKIGKHPLWKIPLKNAEQILSLESQIVILDATGKILLLNRTDGSTKSIISKSDADVIYKLAPGTLGLFTGEGALMVVDTLLQPLWNFNFAKPLLSSPIYTDGNIYLSFDPQTLQGIDPLYYGKSPLLSERLAQQAAILYETHDWDSLPKILDSLLTVEPGNAEAWLFKALMLEQTNGNSIDKQKAWSEAVRLSVSNPQITSHILNHYSRTIGAKFVSLLNISPKTKYPQFFGNKKTLYTVDPAAERLISINAETGESRSSRIVAKMDNSPVIANDENTLAIASGFDLTYYDLSKENSANTIQLPGKAFNISISGNSLYVSTWNGFLLKIIRDHGRMAWSRKIFSVPFLFAKDGNQIHVASLEGDLYHIWEGSGQIKNQGPRLQNGISQMVESDSILAIATNNNRLYLYSTTDEEREPVQILMESPVASLQTFHYQDNAYLMLGLANQEILLYSIQGAPLWKFQGKNSIFSSPYIHGDFAWLDQGNEVVGISLKDGKIAKRFSTPGGAGTPFVLNNTLYSASSKRLLYGFSL